jgi:hypothetical protein
MCSVALPAHAVQVYVEAEDAYNRLDTFYLPVRLDTQGVCVNSAHVALAYDPTALSVKDVSVGRSIFTLWTQQPTIHKDTDGREVGRVTFEGGIPGGYCGRVEGDPGLTNIMLDLIVTGVPKALAAGDRERGFVLVEPGTRVYLHDGTGAETLPTFLGAEFTLLQSTSTPQDVWLQDVLADDIAPEFFEITLVEGPSVGHNKHYIVFSTVDKQSGVDHYEVLETDPDRFGLLVWVPKSATWVRAESPYVLRDQYLRSKILVKAVDKKGNERVAEYVPPMSPLVEFTHPVVLMQLLIILIVLVAGTVAVLHLRRRKRTTSPAVASEHPQEHYE